MTEIKITEQDLDAMQDKIREYAEEFIAEPHKFALNRLNQACSTYVDDVCNYAMQKRAEAALAAVKEE